MGEPTEMREKRVAREAAKETAALHTKPAQLPPFVNWVMGILGFLAAAGILGAVVMYATVASLGAKMDAHIAASASPQELIDAAEARINNTLAADEARRVEDDREFREKMREIAARLRDLERN